jgi:hypothetical protein
MPAVQKIWNEIQTSCSDAINDMKQAGKLLYRGLKTETRPAFHDRSKTRRPRDSDPFISQVFDYCLVQLGAKALRSNSTFTTSDKFQSEGYGNLYMIFPVNGQYTFTWTNTKDLIIDRDDIDIFINRQKIHELNDEINYIVIEESKMLRNDPRHDMDIIQALSPLKNISLGELFYTLCDPESSIHTVDLKKYNLNLHWEYYVDVDSMKNRYEPRFSDLAAAIESGNEVCISGQYIALSTLFFESFVIKSLGMSPPKPTSPY